MAELSRSVGNNMFTDTYRRFIEKQDEEAIDEALYEAKQQHEALKQRLKQMRDQREQRRSRPLSRWDHVMKTMERRYAEGEFGEPPNFDIVGYNKAMRKLIDEPTKTSILFPTEESHEGNRPDDQQSRCIAADGASYSLPVR